MTIDEATTKIRAALRTRSGKSWSVTKITRGTCAGGFRVDCPTSRWGNWVEERHELQQLFGLYEGWSAVDVAPQGFEEFVARAEGTETRPIVQSPMW